MSARSSMTHRAVLRRPVRTTDAWGQDSVSSPAGHEILPVIACKVYKKNGKLVLDNNKIARVDEMRIRFPLNADVRALDELGDVTDRLDKVLFKGPFVIRAPIRLHGHQEASLEGHSVD